MSHLKVLRPNFESSMCVTFWGILQKQNRRQTLLGSFIRENRFFKNLFTPHVNYFSNVINNMRSERNRFQYLNHAVTQNESQLRKICSLPKSTFNRKFRVLQNGESLERRHGSDRPPVSTLITAEIRPPCLSEPN